MSQLLRYEDPELPRILPMAAPEDVGEAPFGIVALDEKGRVLAYNRYEQELANLDAAEVVGRDFFVEIAPCTNNFMVREKFFDTWARAGTLDERVPYTFTYRLQPTRVELRLVVVGKNGWMLVRVLDEQ